MPTARGASERRAQEILAESAGHLSAASDLVSTLQGIASAAQGALGADRATCYVYDVGSQVVSAVHTTEEDPKRRAFLERSVGLGAAELPIWRLQLTQADPLLAIEDVTEDPVVAGALATKLGSGAFLGVRLEHLSAHDRGEPALLGTLFCSYARPRTFTAPERQAARGLANLASLALANARLQAQTARSLEENRALTAEQGALRRVAMLVAGEAAPETVFAQVAEEAAALLGAEAAIVARFTAKGATVAGRHGQQLEVGEFLPAAGGGALAMVARTAAPATIDDYSALAVDSPLRAHALANGFRASVAAPVASAGRLWGAVLATTTREGGLPAAAATRLERFAELVGLAIANTEARTRLAAQAASDPLTGLANHRAFFEQLHADAERAARHGRPLSLITIDLDHFKRVNDLYGHPVGDRVLVEVAERLTRLTRAGDTLARIGGEEFAWLLPESDVHAAWSAAERARGAIGAEPFPEVGRMTMSAGVARLAPGGSVNELVRAADAALYWAKSQGRDVSVPYAPEHERAMAARPAGAATRLSPSVEHLLALAREQLGLALTAIGEFEGDKRIWRHLDGDGRSFGVRLGAEAPLEDTYCQRVAQGRLPSLIRDARRDERVRDLAVTEAAGIGAYIGVPITLPDGSLYGVLCCLSSRAEPALGERDVRLLRIVAGMLGNELERSARVDRVHHRERESILRVLGGDGLGVVFQPIVELAGGRVVAVEALTRFRAEPDRPPDVWFAQAAAVGLGRELELAAMRTALAQLGTLPPGVRLSLNVSPATLLAPELLAALAEAPGERLALELTEHAPVDDYEALAPTLRGLRARGVQLMIDDAGAGFASLRHVLGLHPDVIKLDLSLTRDVDSDPVRRALAASLVAFAREIGAQIVAEGIETKAELDALRGLGVTLGQGFYIARPSAGAIPTVMPVAQSDDVAMPVP